MRRRVCELRRYCRYDRTNADASAQTLPRQYTQFVVRNAQPTAMKPGRSRIVSLLPFGPLASALSRTMARLTFL